MPEETTDPSESKKRRPATAPKESGGKTLPIILVVVILGLAFGLYKRNASAGDQAEADAKSITTLSNQVSELRTKMPAEQMDAHGAITHSLDASIVSALARGGVTDGRAARLAVPLVMTAFPSMTALPRPCT